MAGHFYNLPASLAIEGAYRISSPLNPFVCLVQFGFLEDPSARKIPQSTRQFWTTTIPAILSRRKQRQPFLLALPLHAIIQLNILAPQTPIATVGKKILLGPRKLVFGLPKSLKSQLSSTIAQKIGPAAPLQDSAARTDRMLLFVLNSPPFQSRKD